MDHAIFIIFLHPHLNVNIWTTYEYISTFLRPCPKTTLYTVFTKFSRINAVQKIPKWSTEIEFKFDKLSKQTGKTTKWNGTHRQIKLEKEKKRNSRSGVEIREARFVLGLFFIFLLVVFCLNFLFIIRVQTIQVQYPGNASKKFLPVSHGRNSQKRESKTRWIFSFVINTEY